MTVRRTRSPQTGQKANTQRPWRLLCLWVETSNASPNGTGASCVAHTTSVTRSVAALKTPSVCSGPLVAPQQPFVSDSVPVVRYRLPGQAMAKKL
ncbi:hypothetical protein GCM10010121_098460 [Streptomyces brasiliensis]|uniref:Uncharacterized protein n=1 Tax=Streptomyces brasiliensis TaxID=1954 RepID=A0A917PE41_9ACTN|nr:hypothetical protein GCM10010121_098460 [Streptomyces brasiliensis]